jgi:L,D-transpeptidase YcbB
LIACNGHSTNSRKTSSPVLRDTTITPSLAVTELRLDSNLLEKYIEQHLKDDNDASLLRNFYNSRNFQPAWFNEEGLTESAQSFWNGLTNHIRYSRDSSLYDSLLTFQMEALLEGDSITRENIQTEASIELQLTRKFFDYASHAYAGQTDPVQLQWHIPRKKVDAVALLDSLVQGKGGRLEEIEPLNPQYKLLKKELIRYYELEKKKSWTPLTFEQNSYRKGDKAPAIRELKRRLYFLGDLSTADTSEVYTDATKNAIQFFQMRHGLKEDGIAGQQVLNALNVPTEKRIEQILINLERMRWLPSQPEDRQIVANIPEFRLHVYENGREVMAMDIVVGKTANRTVIFSDELKYVVFSPFWNVPRSIVRSEILPSMKSNPDYLSKQNMEVTGNSGGLPVIRQKPGPGNALGKVKFIFPNRYSIYFHDTPAKGLFERSKRAFSHGCIRLHRPFDLAQYLLKDQPDWTEARIRRAMNSSTEKWVTLSETVPVVISYYTAWVDRQGTLHFRDDIYGHDKRMANHLFRHEDHR